MLILLFQALHVEGPDQQERHWFSRFRDTDGEGTGNPLHYSCLENPGDRGAWWAAVHGVAQSWTRLKRLSAYACIGEGTGNPLQCSCLENPKDGGAWWAAVHGVAQSRTRLKRLSSSSSSSSGLVGDTDIQYYVASVIQEGGTECCRNTGRNSPLELR